jgi:hypothetical protein
MRQSIQLILSCLMVLLSYSSTQASEPLNRFLYHQIEKSQRRVQTLFEKHQGFPANLGAEIGRMMPVKSAESVKASYEEAYHEAIALLNTWPFQNSTGFEFTLKASGLTWRVLQAENRVRWIYLRDTALGVAVAGKGILILIGSGIWLQKRKRGGKRAGPERSARLEVTRECPLDFLPPQLGETQTKLHQQAREMGFLSPLVEKMIRCFAAYPDHPASLQDHLNVPGGLI